jgi:hypothetical protein
MYRLHVGGGGIGPCLNTPLVSRQDAANALDGAPQRSADSESVNGRPLSGLRRLAAAHVGRTVGLVVFRRAP